MNNYKIVRIYRPDLNKAPKTIKIGLTLKQARLFINNYTIK